MVSLINYRQLAELGPQAAAPLVPAAAAAADGPRTSQLQLGATYLGPELSPSQKRRPPLAHFAEQPGGGHFQITWSQLSYQVEPKWYERRWSSLLGSAGAQAASEAPSASSSELGAAEAGQGRPKGAPLTATTILDSLNGSVRSGQVTAILGPSGAGKTSLLSCLTGKKRSGVSGRVLVHSAARTEPLSICTIPQKDYLLNQLTVRENLWFASRLKHPEAGFDHDSNIGRVLELLKLESCIDTKISKISGGQYKRVSIAQELLSSPDILILDEPTSGLDSLTCYKTVMVLRELARLSANPMAILVTIHQPQREVFELFQHVYILALGGRCIYEGQPQAAVATVNAHSAGQLHFSADQYNPASYLVEIASAEFGPKPIEALVEYQRLESARRLAEVAAAAADSAALLAPQPEQARGSPAIARLKASLLSPGSPKPAKQHPKHQHQHQHQHLAPHQHQYQHQHQHQHQLHQQAAYTNQAFQGELQATSAPKQQQLEPTNQFYLDNRLQTHKHNHQGHFLRHCQLLTKRSWLCLCKDPMLTTLRFSAHIIVPLLITLVYGSRVGRPNACPLYESDMDLIDYARRGAKRLLQLQTELRSTFENVGLYFLSIYAFTFSTMCLTSLSFPLSMHVLLKEVRNGWYSIPTYFIGKTLADFPLEFILPTVTLMITYPLTGQPGSYLQWRFLLATGIFVVTSLIAQTQGLIFGALFMNAMQAAVFVAPVSTTPLILLSGFLIRISQMPHYLQQLSALSYFRYAIESLTIIRYGFGQCPCDPSQVTGEPVSATGVPDQLRTMTNYWLSTFNSEAAGSGALNNNNNNLDFVNNTTTELGSTVASGLVDEQPVDFFQDLTVLLARANSFGADIRTCKDLKPYPMIDFSLEDSQLYTWVAALVGTLLVSKVINYLVVKYSVKLRL